MTAGAYRISDEPRPGALSALVFEPFWPLVAAMLAGSWLALPWFALNGAAVGSPTWRRELGWIALGLAVSAAGALGLLAVAHGLPRWAVRSLVVVLVAWRLLVAYRLHELQRGPVELFRWHGGAVRNGALVAVLAAFVAGPALTRAVPASLQDLFFLVLG